MKITPEIIKKISSYASKGVTEALVTYLPAAALKYEINTPTRLAHFLAQCAVESDSYKVLEEYASGKAYEGRADLGNTQKGDGVRYKGRGIIQLTGRANYTEMSKKLGVDLVGNPELAETPEIAILTACEYWKGRKLNALADEDSLEAVKKITKKVNGGYNHLKERQDYFLKIRKITPIIFSGIDIDPAIDYIRAQKALNDKSGAGLIVDGAWGPKSQAAFEEWHGAKSEMTFGLYKMLIG